MKLKQYFLVIFCIFFIYCSSSPRLGFQPPNPKSLSPKTYTVTKVYDGDTVKVSDGTKQFRIRFAGIDTPEYDQAFGQEAKRVLKHLLLNQKIEIQVIDIDLYDRPVAYVFFKGEEVGLTMIKKGLAFYYRPTCQNYPKDADSYNYKAEDYVKAEAEAKKKKIGMWEKKAPALPCVHRRMKKPY